MTLGIGIDTGGTYTDAVVYEYETGRVLAKSKSPTTRDDLAKGICRALDKLPEKLIRQADRVSLSTTLATNACVEGKGGRAKLIIAGTSESVLKRVNAPATYGIEYDDVLPVPFSGTFDGIEAKVPDWPAICDENDEFFRTADSFGIAGLFALNNGAIAERTGAEYFSERYGKPVIMATSVAAALNVISRLDDALFSGVKTREDVIRTELSSLEGVETITGMGLMIGILPKKKTAAEIAAACMADGLLVLTAHEKVRLLPPLNISMDDLRTGLEILKKHLA